MAEVSSWVFTICSGALVCGIVAALIPGKTYEGAIQLLLGLFMLFCFLSPLSLHWSFPRVDWEDAEDKRMAVAESAQEQLAAQVERAGGEQLLATVTQLLEPLGIREEEIELSVETEGDQPHVAIRLPARLRERRLRVAGLLKQELGLPVEITYGAATS